QAQTDFANRNALDVGVHREPPEGTVFGLVSGRTASRDQPTTEIRGGINAMSSSDKLEQSAGKLTRRFRRQVVAGFSNDSALIGAGEEACMLRRLRRRADARGFAVQRDRGNRDLRLRRPRLFDR